MPFFRQSPFAVDHTGQLALSLLSIHEKISTTTVTSCFIVVFLKKKTKKNNLRKFYFGLFSCYNFFTLGFLKSQVTSHGLENRSNHSHQEKTINKEKAMVKKTVLFVFALLFFVNAAFAAVNINKADQATLEALPGIGAAKAAAIIEYRTKNGNFKTKEQLLEVKGIGPKILEKLDKEIEI